jgi:serine/threonine protein kinase
MDKYKVVKKLGEGAYGVVLKCVNTETNEVVAIKKMKGKFASWDECMNMKEIKALKKLNNHQNLIKIKEMTKKIDELNIVFEYCDRNLYQEMQDRQTQNKPFTE